MTEAVLGPKSKHRQPHVKNPCSRVHGVIWRESKSLNVLKPFQARDLDQKGARTCCVGVMWIRGIRGSASHPARLDIRNLDLMSLSRNILGLEDAHKSRNCFEGWI